ncbi:MAG TPA: M23 family metallopeptidase [Longimicrobium sp.]|uniref:M23 family metallopeptidase n=1 Tax=Longimicrobium sp. TaxID=2029185 RepID=UPI002EDB5C91
MPTRIRYALAAAAFALLCGAPVTAQQQDTARMQTGRRYTQWMYASRMDSLYSRLGPQMLARIGSLEQFTAFRSGMDAQLGTETELMSEELMPSAPHLTAYRRTARFSRAPVPVQVTIVTDSAGTIHGFGVAPRREAAPSRFMDYQPRTPLRLPFDGEWYVFWGGRTLEQNYHAMTSDQRFAYDLVIRRDGSSHSGDGSALEQYYCYGQPILAPGDGTVATVVDGLPDQRIGSMDRANPAGNHVIIDHGNSEFSLLAHLRPGSVAVRAGDRVRAGQKLGECGNSGNTSEPHLHYHLQNGPVFGRAEGLPAIFRGYTANGQRVEQGEPVRGQTIRQ